MRNLNSFTGLESLHCHKFRVGFEMDENEKRMALAQQRGVRVLILKNPYELPDNLKNRTIKHLRIANQSWDNELSKMNDLREWSKYFLALETIVILEPEYSEVRVSDLRN